MQIRFIIAVIVSVVFLVGCGVSQEDYDKLNSKYQKLVTDNSELIKELDELKNGEAKIIGKIEKANNEKKYSEAIEYINNLYEKFPESTKNKEYQELLKQLNSEVAKEKELLVKAQQLEQKQREVEEKEKYRLANLNNTGIWRIGYYSDEFGELTKESLVTNSELIKGVFSNSATENSELNVKFLIDNESSISIKLFEYGRNNPVKGYASQDYSIYIQDKDGQRFKLEAYNPSDRLRISDSNALILHNALMKGGTIKFKIVENRISTTQYSFTIDNADWYSNAFELLKATKPVEEKKKEKTKK